MADVLDKRTMKVLGSDVRQEIIKMLAKRPYTASEIAKATGKHVTTISEHLSMLENTELVKKKDTGNKWIYYTLTQSGEKLLKPHTYSWVVVFSLSVLAMGAGLVRVLGVRSNAVKETTAAGAPAVDTAGAVTVSPDLGIVLIALGAIGLIYLAYKKWK